MDINSITRQVIQAAIRVHNELGPGLLESVYQAAMLIELREMGLDVQPEVKLPVKYRGRTLEGQHFRIDLLVEDLVVVELKSTERVLPLHKKQVLTYLRLARKPLGLLINFNESAIKNGLTRIANSACRKGSGLVSP